jgi:hypothetical protein
MIGYMSDTTDGERVPGPPKAVKVGTAVETDSALPARVVTHGHLPDGSEKITVGGVAFHSTSVSVGEDQQQEFHGEPPRNEQDVHQVCRTLRSVLNARGGKWGRFRDSPGHASDVDAIADDESGGPSLQVQVTRVERGAWKILAKEGMASLTLDTEAQADGIRDAAESKSKKYSFDQRGQLVLALDACRSPAYVQKAVVAIFLAKHREWVARLGYRAVWLVGPTDALTFRLDGPA